VPEPSVESLNDDDRNRFPIVENDELREWDDFSTETSEGANATDLGLEVIVCGPGDGEGECRLKGFILTGEPFTCEAGIANLRLALIFG
jgi:hypothetical protein